MITKELIYEGAEKGIIQRVLDNIYQGFDRAQLEPTCLLRVSFFEIYNDTVTDLLADDTSVLTPNQRQEDKSPGMNSSFDKK